jgi:hypothetical protein
MPLMERLGAEGSPPRHQTSPFQHSATHEHPTGTMKHHLKCITLWHGSLAEAVLFYDILPDLSANTNDYEDPFVTAYYNQ